MSFISGAAIALADALGRLPPASLAMPRDLATLWIARLAHACVSLVGVGLAGAVAARFYSKRAGLVAAALMAVLPFEVLQAHYASTDPLLVACLAATLLASLEIERRDTTSATLAAGACAGMAFATKYTGLAALVAPGWAVLEVAWRQRSPRRLTERALAVGAGFVVSFFLGCPQCALRCDLMRGAMATHRDFARFSAYSESDNFRVPSLGWYGKPHLYELVASLPWAFGWPMYALVLLGIARALRVRAGSDRVILVSIGAFFAAMASSDGTWPRYMLPMSPGAVVLAARWVAEDDRFQRARVAALVLVLGYSIALTASQVARFSWRQQEGVARYARAVLFDPFRATPRTVAFLDIPGDYFRLGTRNASGVRALPLHGLPWFADHPDAFVLPEWEAISIRRDWPGSRAAKQLDELESGAAGYTPVARWASHYLQDGFYRWLDPGFAADLWQGEIGFTFYLRDDLAAQLKRGPASAGSAAVPATAQAR